MCDTSLFARMLRECCETFRDVCDKISPVVIKCLPQGPCPGLGNSPLISSCVSAELTASIMHTSVFFKSTQQSSHICHAHFFVLTVSTGHTHHLVIPLFLSSIRQTASPHLSWFLLLLMILRLLLLLLIIMLIMLFARWNWESNNYYWNDCYCWYWFIHFEV